LKVVDGARARWFPLILLDAMIFILHNNFFRFGTRRAFNQVEVLYNCILEEVHASDFDFYDELSKQAYLEQLNWADKMDVKHLNNNPHNGDGEDDQGFAMEREEMSNLLISVNCANKFPDLAVADIAFPWNSVETLKNHLLRDPPSKSKQKYMLIIDYLTSHRSFLKSSLDFTDLIKATICKVLAYFGSNRSELVPRHIEKNYGCCVDLSSEKFKTSESKLANVMANFKLTNGNNNKMMKNNNKPMKIKQPMMNGLDRSKVIYSNYPNYLPNHHHHPHMAPYQMTMKIRPDMMHPHHQMHHPQQHHFSSSSSPLPPGMVGGPSMNSHEVSSHDEYIPDETSLSDGEFILGDGNNKDGSVDPIEEYTFNPYPFSLFDDQEIDDQEENFLVTRDSESTNASYQNTATSSANNVANSNSDNLSGTTSQEGYPLSSESWESLGPPSSGASGTGLEHRWSGDLKTGIAESDPPATVNPITNRKERSLSSLTDHSVENSELPPHPYSRQSSHTSPTAHQQQLPQWRGMPPSSRQQQSSYSYSDSDLAGIYGSPQQHRSPSAAGYSYPMEAGSGHLRRPVSGENFGRGGGFHHGHVENYNPQENSMYYGSGDMYNSRALSPSHKIHSHMSPYHSGGGGVVHQITPTFSVNHINTSGLGSNAHSHSQFHQQSPSHHQQQQQQQSHTPQHHQHPKISEQLKLA
jgi:hypothetical protein